MNFAKPFLTSFTSSMYIEGYALIFDMLCQLLYKGSQEVCFGFDEMKRGFLYTNSVKTFHSEQKVSITAVIPSSCSDKGTLSQVVYILFAPNLNEHSGGIKYYYVVSATMYVCACPFRYIHINMLTWQCYQEYFNTF